MIFLLSEGAIIQFQDVEIRVLESSGIAFIPIENTGDLSVPVVVG